MVFRLSLLLAVTLAFGGCSRMKSPDTEPDLDGRRLLDKYSTVRLTADLSGLTDAERRMIPLLMQAADHMNGIFWMQAYGRGDSLLATIDDPALKAFARINYGPWDRLENNRPFLPGFEQKPEGANFYPPDITREEFERAAAADPSLRSPYTMVRRDGNGTLTAIPYHVFFQSEMDAAAGLLEQAAALAPQPALARYLRLRADALRTDEYYESDVAWMEMKDNTLDIVIGPIENYEDGLFGYKTAAESYVLIKDLEWSRRLSRYVALLPMLQEGLPVAASYRQEKPGTSSDLNAYDVVYYSGDSNAGSKTIAINLPNDERVQLEHGTRRLQLKNSMRAKFDRILVPIAQRLIATEQQPHVTFDAFFGNTMFHEVAHGLGIKNVVRGSGTVREALRDHYSTMEEGKADVLGLYMVDALVDAGEMQADMLDHYTTFLAGIFRSVRFGGASAHGRANMIRFNYFKERGAFQRNEQTGRYRVDPSRFEEAVNALSEEILMLQGNGDYAAVQRFIERYGVVDTQLENDLRQLGAAGIPVDIVFEQGPQVLDLQPAGR